MADGDERGEPAWPSDDRDGTPGAQDHATHELEVPKVTNADPPTVWARTPVPPPQPPRPRPQQPRRPPPRPPQQAAPPPRPRVEVQQATAHPARPMRIEPTGEQRPAPATPPEEPPAPAIEREEPKPKRRRRGLLAGSLALVVLLLAGVALALPAVSNRLGLPWAPNAPQGAPPEPIAVSRELRGAGASAPAPTPAGVAAVLDPLADDPTLGTFGGSVIDPVGGTTLWERQPNQALTPASTVKTLTAAAALLSLDHDKRISTKVVAGEEPGTVVLVAGGDVTLSSLPEGKDSIYPGAAHLDDLVAQVKQATDGDVRQVKLDLGAFAGPTTAPGWAGEDTPSTYAAQLQPAMLDGGRTVPDSEPTDDHSMRVADPAATLAQEFADRLGAQVADTAETTAPAGARILGEVRSAPITQLVNRFLEISDNVLAEAVARQVAIAEGREPSFEGAAQAMLDVLSRNGFDVGGVTLPDASGLSTRDRVPPATMSRILAVAAAPEAKDPRTAKLRPMLGGLPVAGGTGTLFNRYTREPAADGRGWVRAKTGTIPSMGVNSLVGVVLDAEGRVLVFAFMSSGSQTEPAREAIDRMAAALRGCGCR